MSDDDFARRAVRELLQRCVRALAAEYERHAQALRRWL